MGSYDFVTLVRESLNKKTWSLVSECLHYQLYQSLHDSISSFERKAYPMISTLFTFLLTLWHCHISNMLAY
jgi:F0F1-type ATP synthase membrane subunit a